MDIGFFSIFVKSNENRLLSSNFSRCNTTCPLVYSVNYRYYIILFIRIVTFCSLLLPFSHHSGSSSGPGLFTGGERRIFFPFLAGFVSFPGTESAKRDLFSTGVVQKYHRMLNKITIVRCYPFIRASRENIKNLWPTISR